MSDGREKDKAGDPHGATPEQFNTDFLTEQIKQRPVNRRLLLRRTLITLFLAVLFGVVACFVFLRLEPIFNKMMYPEEPLPQISFPEETPEEETTLQELIAAQENAEGSGTEEASDELQAGGEAAEGDGQSGGETPDGTGQDSRETAADPALPDAVAAAQAAGSPGIDQIEQVVQEVLRHQSADVTTYRELYGALSEVARSTAQSMVGVAGISADYDWFNDPYETSGRTSGVIVADNGKETLILCCGADVLKAQRLQVTFADGTQAPAQIKGEDAVCGIAVLTVSHDDMTEDTVSNLQIIQLGSSSAQALIGRPVIAIGRPTGENGSVCYGTVTGNSTVIDLPDLNFKRITTDIYTGSSAAGIIIDLNGQMLGLIDMRNTIKGAPNVLTAVGITEMKKTVEILSNGLQKPFLGIHGTDVNDQANEELGVPKGVFLTSVEMNSPAMLAGLRSGDVITAIDGEKVSNYKEFIALLLNGEAERTAQITLMRLGLNGYEEMTAEAALRPVFEDTTQEEPERIRPSVLD